MNSTLPKNTPFLWWKRVFSLCDVQTYLAARLLNVARQLDRCHFITLESGPSSEAEKTDLARALHEIEVEAEAIGLRQTAILTRRLLVEVKTQDRREVFSRIHVLEERFDDEVKGVMFFFITPDKFKFYGNEQPAGEDFKNAFSTANGELLEAGKCLALDRYTASVFHAMRAMELVLRSLERALKIAASPIGPENTWGKVLARIKTKLEENSKTPPVNWADEREFYETAHAFLRAVQLAFRDSAMHVKATYDEESASGVFRLATEAGKHMATRLYE